MLTRTYSIPEISDVLGVPVSGKKVDETSRIDRIATDSRYKGIGHSSLFFAIRTKVNDGHKYLADAYSKGVRVFVVEKGRMNAQLKHAAFFEVENVLEALQKLARFHRNELDYPLIGITGSNGKTIVKEWLFQVLSTRKNVYKSPKSYNSQIGVPLSVLLSPNKADFGIVEAGISQPGEMENLQTVIEPDIGLITNIHNAHIENFSDREELLGEKLKLFSSCSQLIYRMDYEIIDRAVRNHSALKNMLLITWSTSPEGEATYRVKFEKGDGGGNIEVVSGSVTHRFEVSFSDEASLENVTHCIVAALHLRIDSKAIALITPSLSSVAMRLQLLEGINNCTVINDTYNSDITSLEIALNFLNMQSVRERKTLILSDILQSGIDSGELYRRVDDLCKSNSIDRIIGVGDDIKANKDAFDSHMIVFSSTDELIDQINEISFINENILLKGSRPFEFERISNLLVNKRHETSLEVNLSAVIDNLNFYRSRLKKDVKVMVMVKAFSYGTGTYEIANVLEHYGADYLAVAYIDEGVVLREKGIQLPIMVMNPAIGEIDRLMEYNLEPEVYNLSDLKRIDSFTTQKGGEMRIHLKLETGMHRLGLEKDEIRDVVTILKSNKHLRVASVFSHLVASDDETSDAFTEQQSASFEEMVAKLEKEGVKGFFKHLLNSDGILRFPEKQFDMVRLGIGLYGITSVQQYRQDLRSVIRLKSRISQVKKLRKGDSVGYSRKFVAPNQRFSATVPIGYADGLPRQLGNGKWYFRMGEHKAPILGNVCMDMTMIDVTDVPGIREKDEVVVIDGNRDLYKMAELRQTIPYEVLTSFSERVKRVYYYGD